MPQTFIPFPSIGQYREAIKVVKDNAQYHNTPVPSLTFVGTVKLHGTNAGVVVTPSNEVYFQSRERVITPESDNAGFATWGWTNKEYFINLAREFSKTENVQIFGEWCGSNIQKGVGLNKLPKMFVVFAVKIGDTHLGNWVPVAVMNKAIQAHKNVSVYSSLDFPTFFMQIDFNSPELFQNALQELTLAVEQDCPVARKLLPDCTEELIGEGIVWEVVVSDQSSALSGLRFKVKGEKHSASKVKVLASVDTEKVESIIEFVEYACTLNRLQQGLEKLTEKGLEVSIQNIGEYLKWINSDIVKEEIDTLSKAGLCIKDVGSKVSAKAKMFYVKTLNDLVMQTES